MPKPTDPQDNQGNQGNQGGQGNQGNDKPKEPKQKTNTEWKNYFKAYGQKSKDVDKLDFSDPDATAASLKKVHQVDDATWRAAGGK